MLNQLLNRSVNGPRINMTSQTIPKTLFLYTLEHLRLSGIKAMTYLPGIGHPDYLPSVVAEVSGTLLVGQMV